MAAVTTVLFQPAVAQAVVLPTVSIAQAQSSSIFDMSETHLTAISIVLSTIGGAAVYMVNESWKRRQYIEEKIKDFETSPETINVRKMLSAELQCIELFPFVDKAMERFVIVDDRLWAAAILACKCNHTLQEEYDGIDRETPLYLQEPAVKSCIRDNFNRFLHHLQHFEKMIQAGALDKEKLRSYLYPWFETIKQIGTSESVKCPATKQQYTQHTALLEYMGLLDTVLDDQLSIVQRDVRALVTRYRSLSSFLEGRSSTPQATSKHVPCPDPGTA
ncbi:hypothetical protein [Adonisia turfae]|uniref:hypothetical protein n=1 Tax=Adonisia turfae TaxID=2950184 RepID=UPI0013D48528|nr:hypothetical protein [Adonisia turfae]